MIYLAVEYGTRWGELIGLQRENLDLANRRVRVVDQLVGTADGKFHRTEPKTNRRQSDGRIVQAEMLARHLGWQLSMEAAVARALEEHRGRGHTVAIMRNDTIVSLAAGQY